MQHQCVTCGGHSPEVQTLNALIGDMGWRLLWLAKTSDGSRSAEWRCPACWQEYKKAATLRSPSSAKMAAHPVSIEVGSESSRCAGCGEGMPPELSMLDTSWFRYGWRVSRTVAATGGFDVAFYCPACWKSRMSAPPPASSPE